MSTDLGRWEPLLPQDVVDAFHKHPGAGPWWFAGGYAIELFVGMPLRKHDDIDVLLLRRDQQAIHQVFAGWDIQAADPPGRLRPWPSGETLPPDVHDIWCRDPHTGPWRIQFMLDELDGDLWRSRRNPAVFRAVSSIGRRSPHGWPYLAPEIQLFYKAKEPRTKDELDFAATLPHLQPDQRAWLDSALAITQPDHHWRTSLTRATLP